MHRRRAIALLVAFSGAAAMPQVSAQESGKTRRIGFLAPLSRSTPSKPDPYYDAFVLGLRDLGYVEGRNLVIEWRFADGKFDRLPALAAELVRADVEVIATHATPAIRALQQATSTIPIVFAVALDPVGSGFAASIARPGGNITGLSVIDVDPTPKRLELLKTLLPSLARVAVLVNPGTSSHPAMVKSVQVAGQHAGVTVQTVEARTPEEIERAFGAMAQGRAQGAIVADDSFFRGQRQQLAELTVKHRMPVIAPWREYVTGGGLMSYGQSIADSFRRTATYVDKILKGARPGDLPIEQPTIIHLAINTRTAKALGLTIPRQLVLRADEVIE